MDIFATYETDETKENEGTWVEIGDAKFLVARSGNRKYVKMLTKLVEKNQRVLDRKDEAADKLSDQIMVDVMAETILLGWEGVTQGGQDWPYSVGNAKAALAVKDFRREIMKIADDAEEYKAKQVEETEKN